MFGWENIAAAGAGGVLSFIGNERTNAANRNMAENQMAFQERMSNTAYQRSRADLEAAGYNPALAFSNGPASTPAGAIATMSNSMEAAVTNARESALLSGAIKKQKTENALNEKLAEQASQNTRTLAEQANLYKEQQQYTKANKRLAEASTVNTLSNKARTDTLKALEETDLPRKKMRERFERSNQNWWDTGILDSIIRSFKSNH